MHVVPTFTDGCLSFSSSSSRFNPFLFTDRRFTSPKLCAKRNKVATGYDTLHENFRGREILFTELPSFTTRAKRMYSWHTPANLYISDSGAPLTCAVEVRANFVFERSRICDKLLTDRNSINPVSRTRKILNNIEIYISKRIWIF